MVSDPTKLMFFPSACPVTVCTVTVESSTHGISASRYSLCMSWQCRLREVWVKSS